MKYRIVEEWSCPIYTDSCTGDVLYEGVSTERQCYWVCQYDDKTQQIVDFIKRFVDKADAEDYLGELGERSNHE